MTAAQIISEIGPLTPEELSSLAERLVQTGEPGEALRVRATILYGFFGVLPADSTTTS